MKKILLTLVLVLSIVLLVGCKNNEVDCDEDPNHVDCVVELTDQEKVDAVKDALSFSVDLTEVTEDLELVTSGNNDVEIEWSSSNTNVIALNGAITRPLDGDVTVTITATITLNDASATKEFSVTVKQDDTPQVDLTKFLNLDFSEGTDYWDFTGTSGNLTGSVKDGGPEGGSGKYIDLNVNKTLGSVYDIKFRQRFKTLSPGVYELTFNVKASDDFGVLTVTVGSMGQGFPAKEVISMSGLDTEWTEIDSLIFEITETVDDVTIEFALGQGNLNGKVDPMDDTIPSTNIQFSDVSLEKLDIEHPGFQVINEFKNLDFETLSGWDITPYVAPESGRASVELVPNGDNDGDSNSVDITVKNIDGSGSMSNFWDAKFRQRFISKEAGVYKVVFDAKVDDPAKFNELGVYFGGERTIIDDITSEWATYEAWVDISLLGDTHLFGLEFELGKVIASELDQVVLSIANIVITEEDELPVPPKTTFMNGDFLNDSEFEYWETFSDGTTFDLELVDDATHTKAAKVTVLTGAADSWRMKLRQMKIAYTANETYELKFFVKTSVDTDFNVLIGKWASGMDNVTFVKLPASSTTEWTEVTLLFSPTQDVPDGRLEFELGAAADGTVFYIADVRLSTSAGLTDAEKAGQAKDALSLSADLTQVIGDLTLPLTGINDTTITWASDNEAVITTAGVVTQPTDADAVVTLTATITLNAESVTKTFTVTVLKVDDTNTSPLLNGDFSDGTNDWNLFTDGTTGTFDVIDDATYTKAAQVTVTTGSSSWYKLKLRQMDMMYAADATYLLKFNVKATEAGQINVLLGKWASGNEGISFIKTKVDVTTDWTEITILFTPSQASTDGRLEFELAGLNNGTVIDIANIRLEKNPEITDAQILAIEKALFMLSGDLSAVTNDLTLPTALGNGVTVSWASSDATVIDDAGAVVQPTDADATVTLTATLTLNDATETVTFDVTVLQDTDQPDAPIILNGDFSDGTTNWELTDTAKTTVEVIDDAGTNVAKVTVVENGAEWYFRKFRQANLSLDAGMTYEITLTVKATEADQFRLLVGEYADGKEGIKYMRELVDVTTEWQTLTYIFAPTESSTGAGSRFEFEIGKMVNGNSLYVKDVSVSVVELVESPLLNGDFSDATDALTNWELTDTAKTTVEVIDDAGTNVAKVTVVENGTEWYYRKFRQANLSYDAGSTYIITLEVKATQVDQFRLFIGEYADGKENVKYMRELVDVTTEWQTLTFTFAPTESSSGSGSRFEFEIGKMINGNELFIKNVQIIVVDSN